MSAVRTLLFASLAANIALAVVLLRRPASVANPTATAPLVAGAPKKTSHESIDLTALRAALDSGDRDALIKAGLSEETVRTLAIGRAFDRFQRRMAELRPPPEKEKFWRRPEPKGPLEDLEFRRNSDRAEREFAKALEEASGVDFRSFLGGDPDTYSFLPPAKRAQLRRIERDYDELENQARLDTAGAEMAGDSDRFRVLTQEKERDIAAMLTPEEREQFELRASSTAENVIGSYGDLIQTEAEYRKVFALQKAFSDENEQRPDPKSATPEARQNQQQRRQKLLDDIRAVLDPDSLAAYQRAHDPDRNALLMIGRRMTLPENAPELVVAARESYGARSMQINADTTLSADDRKTQIKALAEKARSELETALGTNATVSLARESPWLNSLKNGSAFSTNPADATGVRGFADTIYRVANPPTRPPAPAPKN